MNIHNIIYSKDMKMKRTKEEKRIINQIDTAIALYQNGSEDIKLGVADMLLIILNPSSDEQEIEMAENTIKDILFREI